MIKFSKIDDKAKHVYAGILISVITGLLFYKFGTATILFSCIIGLTVGTIAGFLKEFVWDKFMQKGTFSWADIAYTFWGSIIGAVILIAILSSIQGLGV